MLFLLLCLSVGDQDVLSGPCRMGSGYCQEWVMVMVMMLTVLAVESMAARLKTAL